VIDVGELRRRIWDSPQYSRILLITCLVGMFSTTFTFTVVTVALKTVAHDLHSTPGVVAWVITAPALAIAVSLPVFGRLGDVAGHRRVYLIGFLVSSAPAPSPSWPGQPHGQPPMRCCSGTSLPTVESEPRLGQAARSPGRL